MGSSRHARLLRQLLAGSGALALVASATFVLGRVTMSEFTSVIHDVSTTAPTFDPQGVIDALPTPAAAVVITGAVDAQLVLDHLIWQSTVTNRPDASSYDIDVSYQGGSGSALRLKVSGITIGEPRTQSITAILTTSGQTFSAQPGDCTLLVHRFEYVPAPPDRLEPTFAGELSCTTAELRSQDLATFIAAFDR
ncbi:MAG: hypothetical protein WEE36_10250 [Acidimicrobiia bacterium]